jgi:hypothetical protein
MEMDELEVHIDQADDGVVLVSGEDRITVRTTHPEKVVYPQRADFAAWFFLPIAMRTNRPLQIHGSGSGTTTRNAATMSNAWQSWLPAHFSSITVSFDREIDDGGAAVRPDRDLCFYSGGVDSTYTILRRVNAGRARDLLTVYGMDYKLRDEEKFEKYLRKTGGFASQASDTRILVETDAYSLYDKYGVNPRKHHVSHIFALAGSAFLHAGYYGQIVIAADVRLDQQFLVYPWGSNSATNHFFDDGLTRLITDSDDVTRCQKMPALFESAKALESLTFCDDYSVRPDNCGVCAKCIRTKLMFLAACGRVPPIFQTDEIPPDWAQSFMREKQGGVAFFVDTVTTARQKGNTALFPRFEENEKAFLAWCADRAVQADAAKKGLAVRLSPSRLLRIARKRIVRKCGKDVA